jgi:hypothetical protein
MLKDQEKLLYTNTVKPVLRGHSWEKEKVAL